jgi:serine protease inhibitor
MYGNGTISKVRLSRSAIYFDIVFIVNGIQVNKSFSATIAVEKNVLEFENEETASFYNELKNTLVPSVKVEVPIIEKKIISDDVSSLKDINSVINFQNNESITQLLINNLIIIHLRKLMC